MWCKNVGTIIFRFVTMHAFDRQTESPRHYHALHHALSRAPVNYELQSQPGVLKDFGSGTRWRVGPMH